MGKSVTQKIKEGILINILSSIIGLSKSVSTLEGYI